MQLAPSALHTAGEDIARLLGWELADPDYDGTVHLHGPLERHIGMGLIHGGSTVQLWATGGAQPADHTPGGDLVPLPQGRRYHHGVGIGSLTEDQDPGVVLYNAIRDNLLPVFDAKPSYVGHRPWEIPVEADVIDVEATVQAAAAAGVDVGDQDEPQSAPEPSAEPQPAPEPQAPVDELAAKRTRKRTTTKPDPAAADKPKPARKRTTTKPAPAAKAAAEPKPARPARKRTTTTPATS
ncbi:hypothetical protein PV342_12430 [Streptomyces sp. PA03-3a]|nr:hypothetical protein [Streptomyces sp. PA03-3a]